MYLCYASDDSQPICFTSSSLSFPSHISSCYPTSFLSLPFSALVIHLAQGPISLSLLHTLWWVKDNKRYWNSPPGPPPLYLNCHLLSVKRFQSHVTFILPIFWKVEEEVELKSWKGKVEVEDELDKQKEMQEKEKQHLVELWTESWSCLSISLITMRGRTRWNWNRFQSRSNTKSGSYSSISLDFYFIGTHPFRPKANLSSFDGKHFLKIWSDCQHGKVTWKWFMSCWSVIFPLFLLLRTR